jgi:hypothetical protein
MCRFPISLKVKARVAVVKQGDGAWHLIVDGRDLACGLPRREMRRIAVQTRRALDGIR